MLEAETAEAYGISFDSNWYDISVISREHMIASRLASKWLEALSTRKAINEAKRNKT